MLRKKKYVLTGIIAAAVVMGVGCCLLRRKILKRRLRELARRQAMNFDVYDVIDADNGLFGDSDFEDFSGDSYHDFD